MIIEIVNGKVYGLRNVPESGLNVVLKHVPDFMESVIEHDGMYTNDIDLSHEELELLKRDLMASHVSFEVETNANS